MGDGGAGLHEDDEPDDGLCGSDDDVCNVLAVAVTAAAAAAAATAVGH